MATFQRWLSDQADRAGDDPVGWLARQWDACEGPDRPRVSAPNGIRKHLLTLSDDEQWQAAVTKATELATKAYNDTRQPAGEQSVQVSGPAEPQAAQAGRGLTEAELSAFRAGNRPDPTVSGPASSSPSGTPTGEATGPELSGQAAEQLLFPQAGAFPPDVGGAGVPTGEPDDVQLLGAATGMLLQATAQLAERLEHVVRLAQITLNHVAAIGRSVGVEPVQLDKAMQAALGAVREADFDGPEQPWNHGPEGLWGAHGQPAAELNGWAAWAAGADPDAAG